MLCCCWNVRSLNNKITSVMDFLSDQSISLLFVTETWMTSMNNDVTATAKSYGFNMIHQIRPQYSDKCRGGGVAIIFNSQYLSITQVFEKTGDSFEAVMGKFRDSSGEFVLCVCIYRPGVLTDVFFTEFDEFIGTIFLKYRKFLICGDFNIHVDEQKSRQAQKFSELLSSYGLHQLVNRPTHNQGHVLDLIITSHKVVCPKSIDINATDSKMFPNCDHFPVKFNLLNTSANSINEKKIINFRNIKGINRETFTQELADELLCLQEESSFEKIISLYNSQCSSVLDTHAPLLTKQIKDRQLSPWFDGEYKALRTCRRKAEKKWRTSGSPEDKKAFETLRDQCTQLSDRKKHEFFRNQFEKHSFSSKSLFNFVDTFLDRDKSLVLPPSDSLKETVENFNTYFEEKIRAIRENFEDFPTSATEHHYNWPMLSEFSPTNVEELAEIIKSCEIKSSSVDPLPAELFKENLHVLLPVLTDIVNASLSSGSIDGAKLAHITPLIKGHGLDSSNLKNYRPISNLSFVGKLIERVVLRRLNEHLEHNNLHIPHQSGYKKTYSTETLLVRVVNDLLIASSESKATVVLMLDLSAAFDTVDHSKLLQILQHELGITGKAWDWFKSFLTGRCQKIKVGNEESYEIIIKFGVPQGSVLGPVLFNIYIRSLYNTAHAQNFLIQGYADDHQLYKSFEAREEHVILVNDVPKCFQEINQWMKAHYLQLNPGKTEILVFGSPAVLQELSIRGVFIDSKTCVRLSPVAKNLGFRLDNQLSFKEQIKQLKSSCYLKLRDLAKMKSFLTTKQMNTLVQAVIISCLDYCNGLYYGCSSTVITQLQNIQNRACRLIFGLKRKDSVQDKIKELHWLKVRERIEFKLCLLAFKAVNGIGPSYLSDIITFVNDSSRRRSSLHIPVRAQNSHPHAFQTVAPKLWNQLPISISSCNEINLFKKMLKTHLFKKSHGLDN